MQASATYSYPEYPPPAYFRRNICMYLGLGIIPENDVKLTFQENSYCLRKYNRKINMPAEFKENVN